MKSRNDYPDQILYTKQQWITKGFTIISAEKEKGLELWTNHHHQMKSLYYRPDQVAKAETEAQRLEIRKFWEPRKQRAKELKKKRIENERQARLVAKERRLQLDAIETNKEKCKAAAANAIPFPNKLITIDIETTGLDNIQEDIPDEILQISIIDGAGHTLLNQYIKPYVHTSWPAAQSINGITPQMVSKAPYLHEVSAKIKSYLTGASYILGYNLEYFDIPFIERWIGALNCSDKIIDLMLDFAPVFGEWNEKYQNYKYQSLATCADYYGITFSAHNSLEDAKATLKCYIALKQTNLK